VRASGQVALDNAITRYACLASSVRRIGIAKYMHWTLVHLIPFSRFNINELE
jgi:hypothetical protein